MDSRSEMTAGAVWRLVPGHQPWPEGWLSAGPEPKEMWGTGNPGVLHRMSIAIVGTRRPSPRGEAVAKRLAHGLARAGWAIISGMARGIDAAAHQGALDADGVTVAVMGTGIDRTYPAAHMGLRRSIEAKGCVVTELEAGSPPLPFHFPRRNRLVSSLARAVIVVEAPIKSGAMLTAYQALDQGREVFAVPGPVDCAQTRGCHKLLREGAHLCEGLDDLHQVLAKPPNGEDSGSPQGIPLPVPGSPARWIWDRLDLTGLRLSELRHRWNGTDAIWREGLLALEMSGLIQRLPGEKVIRKVWIP